MRAVLAVMLVALVALVALVGCADPAAKWGRVGA